MEWKIYEGSFGPIGEFTKRGAMKAKVWYNSMRAKGESHNSYGVSIEFPTIKTRYFATQDEAKAWAEQVLKAIDCDFNIQLFENKK